ncbi:DUF2628 domain-containing protein [Fictibacillus nanhaiensis]|uniref:DUF2628 domain-containing protein n=1 Tax=Fictibacillus nanhaiensis TaxID=742169 RepID=UPI001C93934C|nr:DUF2628 domain-containing protein [Fictibacillus nanhaiensis]MBY6037144.1 DUF2628 domain-containing protein [Fictibacillus nanhaiensis]
MNEALKEPVLFEEEHKVVQKNTAYYDVKWGYVEDPARNNTWNWVAFFFFSFWLAYRKMYKPFIMIGTLHIFWMIPFFLVDFPLWFYFLFYMTVASVVGRNGNRWYYNYVSNVQKQAKTISVPKQVAFYKTKGGADIGMMLGLNALFHFLVFIAFAFLSSLPTETNVKDVVRLSGEGTALESSTDKPIWKYVRKESRYHVVEFSGFDYRSSEGVRIVFHVYHDKYTFDWKEIYIDGKKSNEKKAKEYQRRIEKIK